MNTIKHWYYLLIAGLLFVGVGVTMMISPAVSYISLTIVFVISFVASGVSDIIFSISNKDYINGWMWIFFSGLLSLIVSALLISSPVLSLTILPIYIAFALLFKSMLSIAFARDMGPLLGGSSFVIFFAFLGVILSIVMLINPVFAGMSIVYLTAITFIIAGITMSVLSLSLKGLKE